MELKQIVTDCLRSESPITSAVIERLAKVARLNHALWGMMTELGELIDILKRYIYYGKTNDNGGHADFIHLQEETGDIGWYYCLLLDEIAKMGDSDLEAPLRKIINKLKIRYPDRFNSDMAVERNLTEERKELEK